MLLNVLTAAEAHFDLGQDTFTLTMLQIQIRC